MRYYQIIEGINVSEITTQADRLLFDLFTKMVRDDVKQWIRRSDYAERQKPDHNEDYYDDHTRLMLTIDARNEEKKRGFSGAWACIYKACKDLTQLVQTYLKKYSTDGENVTIDGDEVPLSKVIVFVTQHSKDNRGGTMHRDDYGHSLGVTDRYGKSARGYYGVKINVDAASWGDAYDMAFEEQLRYELFKDDEDYKKNYIDNNTQEHIDFLARMVVLTFAHEVDHLIYYIKTKGDAHQTTHIRNKKGSRHYNNNSDDEPRYMGSNIELQANASAAAYDLVRDRIHAKGKKWYVRYSPNENLEDPSVWNNEIDSIIKDISSSKNYISNALYTYSADFKKATNVKHPEEYQKVWKTFVRLLVKRLQDYKR
jgi:hypothetical protein